MDTLNIIIKLMNDNNCDNKELASYLTLNRQAVTDWKAGRSHSYKKYLPQIAEFFNVSVDYLLGKTEEIKKEPSPEGSATTIVKGFYTEHEINVINAYRAQPEMQSAVDRLLGIEQDGQVRLYTAAHSEDKRFDEITRISKAQFEKIQNAPETDDSLI